MQRRRRRGHKGAWRQTKVLPAQVAAGAAPASARPPIFSNPLVASNGAAEGARRGRGAECRGRNHFRGSVQTCRASLSRTLHGVSPPKQSRPAPLLSETPRVARGFTHQIHTPGTCTMCSCVVGVPARHQPRCCVARDSLHTRPPLSRKTTAAPARSPAHARALCRSPSRPPASLPVGQTAFSWSNSSRAGRDTHTTCKR